MPNEQGRGPRHQDLSIQNPARKTTGQGIHSVRRLKMKKTLSRFGLAALVAAGMVAGLGFTSVAHAQLSLSTEGSPVVIDFAGFDGTGFAPSPAAGQLDSNVWRITGMSDGDGTFGGTHDAGDFARGSSAGGVTTGGTYAFDTGSGTILGIQPGGTDFTPGAITLAVTNNTGGALDQFAVDYEIWVLNDQGRANSLNFAFSLDDETYTPVPAADFVTPEAADDPAAWAMTPRSVTVSAAVANGETIYFQWPGNDVSGGGSRDEYGITNVSITGNETGVTPQAELIAARSFNGNIVATFDINPGAVGAGDFTLVVDGSSVAINSVSGTGSTRTLEPASALPIGQGTVDNLAVADTDGTDESDIDFYVYPAIQLAANGTIPTGVEFGVVGTVTAVVTTGTGDNDVAYVIADTTGPYSGLIVRDTTNTPAVGDEVELHAETFQQFGLLRTDALGYINHGAGTPIAPLEIPAASFQEDDDGTIAGQYVGVLVRFDATLTNFQLDDFNEYVSNEGVRIDDVFYDYVDAGDITNGEDYPITGIGYFSFGNYKVMPRSADDLSDEPTSVSDWTLMK